MADNTLFARQDISFNAEGALLNGWLYTPTSKKPSNGYPVIVMAGGYATTKEFYTDDFAAKFASNGFAVLLYDHRGFGQSSGLPRYNVDPWVQIADYRNAITYASSIETLDPERIGIWGSSYSGGECIVVAATDRRVKTVVAQVPTIYSSLTAKRRVNYKESEDAVLKRINDDRLQVMQGKDYELIPIFGSAESGAAYSTPDAIAWYSEAFKRAPHEEKMVVTLKSVDLSRGYNPGPFLPFVAPTPILMVIGERDFIVGTDIQLEAFNNLALEHKKLHIVKGAGHFDVYTPPFFEEVSNVEMDWYKNNL